jgi:hypothetical protein
MNQSEIDFLTDLEDATYNSFIELKEFEHLRKEAFSDLVEITDKLINSIEQYNNEKYLF